MVMVACRYYYNRAWPSLPGRVANVDFRRWQDRHQLSLTDAAKAIGLTRRTVRQYRTGARPVPRTVTLACKGWEIEQALSKRRRVKEPGDSTCSVRG